MPRLGRLLAQTSSPSLQAAYRMLAAIGVDEVTVVSDPREAVAALQNDPPELALLDLNDGSAEVLLQVPAEHAKRVVLVSEKIERDWLIAAVNPLHFSSLIGRPTPLLAEEINLSVSKILRHDLAGIEKYIAADTPITRRKPRESSQRHALFDEIRAFASSLAIDSRLVEQFTTITDELITNAFYNAPVSEEGDRLYADYSRLDTVTLPEDRAVEVSWGCDGRRLAVAVRDSYGSIDRRTLLRYLGKGLLPRIEEIEFRSGGAGTGLATVYRAASTLVFNVVPGQMTEAIGVLDVVGHYRQIVERGRSIHLFFQGA